LLVSLVMAPAPTAQARPPLKVDIIFMNHGPMQPVVKAVKEILARHGGTASPTWYDFDEPSGQDFMRQKGIKGHIPLLILIDGSSIAQVQGRPVTFAGFPGGHGPYQFQGKWTLDDLDLLLGSSRP
jgi:hypothetical protein